MRSPWGRNPSSNWKWIHSDWGSLWNPFQGGKLLYGVGRDQRSKLRNGLQKGLVRARLLVLHQLELALLGIPPHISPGVHIREPLHLDDRLLLLLKCQLYTRVHLHQNCLKEDDTKRAADLLRLLPAKATPFRRHSVEVRQKGPLTAAQIQV